MFLCKSTKLNKEDMEDMTIGMCIDYIYEHIEQHKPESEKVRRASQSDFDSF